jgi:deoxycytidylate deaminase
MFKALERAEEEALKSTQSYRLGAAIFRGRVIVSSGRNRTDYSCGLWSIHAEMDALWKTRPEDRAGAHLVVVRVLRNGSYACSKPCPACARAISRAGICKVTYTTGDSRFPLRTYLVNNQ